LTAQIDAARLHLFGSRIPITRGATLDYITDIHPTTLPPPIDSRQHGVKELAGTANERLA
jgi:hypothetical protein